MFPMGLDKDYLSEGIFVCIAAGGLFRRKDKFTKCELYPSKRVFYEAEKPFLGWKVMG